MTAQRKCSAEVTLVAIDVAKAWNVVLVEPRGLEPLAGWLSPSE
jgi:hypothetical protein